METTIVLPNRAKMPEHHPDFVLTISMRDIKQTVNLSMYGKDRITFGRKEYNDIVIPSAYVSREHGAFLLKDGRIYYEDYGRNHATINNQALPPDTMRDHAGKPFELSEYDVLRIDYSNTITAYGVEILVSRGSELQSETYDLCGRREITIGRGDNCDIQLNHVNVSRRHAIIQTAEHGHKLLDQASTNGIWVNEKRVRDSVMLKMHDVIRIHDFCIIYHESYVTVFGRASSGPSLDIYALSKTVRDSEMPDGRKTILDRVSLHIDANDLVAIIGGSGAGKSTLLNAVSGMASHSVGCVRVDQHDFFRNYSVLKNIIGYVPQQDIVFDNLTLKSMLMYTAELRMPSDTTRQEKDTRIGQVLEMVGLGQHKDTLISKLSGGQKKRASIAIELLADPRLLFLDEPMSGLDPGTEESLMKSLKELSQKGRTILLVTHSTLNLHLCDKIVVMGKGGRLCYIGKPDDMLGFFQAEHISQIYEKLDNESVQWQKKLRERDGVEPDEPQPQKRESRDRVRDKGKGFRPAGAKKGISIGRQFSILARRYKEIILQNKKQLVWIMGQAVIFAMVLALVNNENAYRVYADTKTTCFVASCLAMWMGLFLAIQEVTKERVILRREYMANLKLTPYILSKIAVLSVLAILQTIVFVMCFAGSNLLIGGTNPGRSILGSVIAENGVTFALVNIASVCMGLLLSSLSKQPERFAPYVLMPQIVLAGVLFGLGDGLFSKISRIIITFWGNRALASSAALNELPMNTVVIETGALAGQRFTPETVQTALYAHTAGNLLLCWGALLLMSALFASASILALRRIRAEER